MICGIHFVRGATFPRFGGVLAVAASVLHEGGETDSVFRLVQPSDHFNYQPRQLRESRLSFADLVEKGVTDDDAYDLIAQWIRDRKVESAVCLDYTQIEWAAEWSKRHSTYFGPLPRLITVDSIEATLRLCGVSPEPFVPQSDLADSKGMSRDLAMWLSRLLGRYQVQETALPEPAKEVSLGRV